MFERVDVSAFAGMMPRVEPTLLPPTAAQSATNVKVTSGALEPWAQPSTVLTLSGSTEVKTIYRFGQSLSSDTQYWFQFTGDVDVVKAPIDGDTEERTLWTDGTYPKKTRASIATTGAPYPSASLRLGVPSPSYTSPPFVDVTFTPTASVSGSPTDASSTAYTSVYVITYVSSWGEEGSPSLPTNAVTWRAGQTITVTLPSAPSGAYDITRLRLYRSNSGTTRTAYQLVKDIAIGPGSTTDTTPNSALEEALPTFDFDMPPDNMVGLTHMGNGILAGFFGNTLCFCEPYYPYAWPTKYQLSTDAPIVGLAAFNQTLFVGTKRGVYLVTGVDPQGGMTMEKIPVSQSCASKRSVVPMLGGVVYASPDGLFLATNAGVQNLTDAILTRTEWQSYKPETITAFEIDGRYYAFYDTGTTKAGLIFTFGDNASFVKTDQWVSAGYQEKLSDTLFVVQNNVTLKKWNAGPAMTATWRSKEFLGFGTRSVGAARVVADTYPVTFKLYVDGTLKSTTTVSDAYPFRLPSGYRFNRLSFEVQTTTRVQRVTIAPTPAMLGG